jgi:uncharacterized protein YciI
MTEAFTMLFAVIFEDDAAHAGKRRDLLGYHLAYLESHASAVKAAGPLKLPGNGLATGGLWLVETGGADEVRRLCENDPFWPTGLRKSVQIREWARVFSDGKRLI